jgi:hypothetical protein
MTPKWYRRGWYKAAALFLFHQAYEKMTTVAACVGW